MGFFEKRKFRNFLIFLSTYEKDKPATWLKGKSLDKMTTRQMYAEFGLDENTQSFTGHAMALMYDDDYLDKPADVTADAIQLYVYSLERYGKSPYIYPMYGLGGMPEGFSRLCAIHGGTFMLNKGIDEVLYKPDGKAWGVKTGNEVSAAHPSFICDLCPVSPVLFLLYCASNACSRICLVTLRIPLQLQFASFCFVPYFILFCFILFVCS
jgi:Rab GDP dissociation inhibitor